MYVRGPAIFADVEIPKVEYKMWKEEASKWVKLEVFKVELVVFQG